MWQAEETTPADRKEIVRCLVERVVLRVRQDSEVVGITVHWQGGFTSEHQAVRPVKLYTQMEGYERLMAYIAELRRQGYTAPGIARKLNEEGYRTPMKRGDFHPVLIRKLLSRLGLANEKTSEDRLRPQEWWLPDLAREIPTSPQKLSAWTAPGPGSQLGRRRRRAMGAVGRPEGSGAAPPARRGVATRHEQISKVADNAAIPQGEWVI